MAPKGVTSGGIRLRGLAPGQHSYKEDRSGGDTAADLTDPGSKPTTSRTDNRS